MRIKFGKTLFFVWCFQFVLLLLWNFYSGMDVNWDMINYHYYGAFSILEDRLGQDYYAGSIQGYFNPLIYVPLYALIQAGIPALICSSILVFVHSLNGLLVFRIGEELLRERKWGRTWLAVAASLLALVSPMLLTTVGSSFADPVTSVLVLAGVFLLLSEVDERRAALIGLLFGVALGLKLTNLYFCFGLLASFWVVCGVRNWRLWLFLSLGGLAGVIFSHGYWSFVLWSEMGNPVFPLANSIFSSPDIASVSLQDRRYIPDGGLASALSLPWRMVIPMSWIYAENVAPDFRFAVFLMVFFAALVSGVRKFGWIGLPGFLDRKFLVVLAFFVASYLPWAMTSSIGRYALPLWLLLGPLVAYCLCLFLDSKKNVAVLVVLSVLQLVYVLEFGGLKWTPAEWQDRWIKFDVPDDLRREKRVVLTLSALSFSAMAPSLHKDSILVNLVGQYVQPAGDRMTGKLKNIIRDDVDSIRIVFKVNRLLLDDEYKGNRVLYLNDADAIISTYGFRLRRERCDVVRMDFKAIQPEGSEPVPAGMHGDWFYSCGVSRLSADEMIEVNRNLSDVDAVFNRIESLCGSAVSPHGMQTMRGRGGYMRSYFNTQSSVVFDGKRYFIRPYRSMLDVDLGGKDDVLSLESCPNLRPVEVGL